MKYFRRKRGISLLLPTQNSERTVELCIRSFVEFPDEIIVVDNGSTDGTKEIVRELEGEYDHLTFFDAPHLKDLYENRQYAFERSRFQWIARFDSDYVAHTDGETDVRNLRSIILQTRRGLRPWAFGIRQTNLVHDFHYTGPPRFDRDSSLRYHVPPPTNDLKARIIQWFPGMRFQRLGRWEGVRWQRYLAHRQLEESYWFHCSFKSSLDNLRRFERTNWREHGDFDRYPTLTDYLLEKVRSRFGTTNLAKAAGRHFEECIKPHLAPFDESKYGPYPALIRDAIRHRSRND